MNRPISICFLTRAEREVRRMERRRRALVCAICFVLGFNVAVYGCLLVIR